MLKVISRIFNYLILLVVCVATIGVNVSKLHCSPCRTTHLQVKVVPGEDACPCQAGCSCCHKGNTKTHPATHSFYKLHEFSQVEKYQFAGLFFVLPEIKTFSPVVRIFIDDAGMNSFPVENPDGAPPLEFLCTFLI